jgi:tetratricopeptide (TPR) repeat protein
MAFTKAKALQEAEKSVQQGKFSQAIKQYLDIFQRDQSDLNLLNTIGDLYVREGNIPEALKLFFKLADKFAQDGFILKAIAICKKIAKLDSNTVDPLLKLAELYVSQGWNREARQHYLQAAEFYGKRYQSDKSLEILRKVVQIDPENSSVRARLAILCEQMGRVEDAAQAYAEAAELAIRANDTAAAEPSLKKALQLAPQNLKAQLQRARLAMSRGDLPEVEKVFAAVPELRTDPASGKLLLEAYLAADKLEDAEKLALEALQGSFRDFTPLASYSAFCLEKGDVDAAFKPLSEVANELIERKNTGPLMECLRRIWSEAPQHIPTLELLRTVSERTGDEFTLPEVLEALGHAYVQAAELPKAEEAYRWLIERERDNEHYKMLLKQVLQRQGKEASEARPDDLSRSQLALTPEVEVPAPSADEDARQAAAVKEALENSNLFVQYGLIDKAIAELEKVLEGYPEQVIILQRLAEICRKNFPDRAAQIEATLAQIHSWRGDLAEAREFEVTETQPGAPGTLEVAPQAPTAEEAQVPPPSSRTEPAPREFDLTSSPEVAGATAPPISTAPAEMAVGLDASPAPLASPSLQAPVLEVDLSEEWEPAATTSREAPAFNFEESREEINFYLQQGFEDEARKALTELEVKFPGDERVAELRRSVEAYGKGATAQPPAEVPQLPVASGLLPALSAPPSADTAFAQGSTEPLGPKAAGGGAHLIEQMVGALASQLDGLPSPAAPSVPPEGRPRAESAEASPASALSGLLDELKVTPGESVGESDDPDTHYDLGVAFREMGLVDEAIGELQKVVRGGGKGSHSAHYLQACSLLAICFVEKKMPSLAVKWYLRALEAPGLDEEASLALQYDLGAAYEQAGDTRTALERFIEVYSRNIDYRDVAEKIRVLQQKVS